jgi:beta-glucosidase
MARKLANESMVLLKNDGVLPLKTSGIKIAVVGPLADQTQGAAGQLQRHSDAHGLRFWKALQGVSRSDHQLMCRDAVPEQADARRCPRRCLTTDGKPGVKATIRSRTHELLQ